MPSFEEEVKNVCNELAALIISKNQKYGDSYRRSRLSAEDTWGSRKIPFDFHAKEKIQRYSTAEDDEEDSVLDLAGYSVLEIVCRRLDDKGHENGISILDREGIYDDIVQRVLSELRGVV